MPVRFRCSVCGHILYEFRGVGQSFMGVPTPDEVVKIVGYVCPSCKRVLEVPSRYHKDYIIIRNGDLVTEQLNSKLIKQPIRLAET